MEYTSLKCEKNIDTGRIDSKKEILRYFDGENETAIFFERDGDYFLANIDRNPCFVDDEYNYTNHLYNSLVPKLLTDNKEMLAQKVKSEFGIEVDKDAEISELKELFIDKTTERREKIISNQVAEIKNYVFYNEIQQCYNTLSDSYDPSLILEWNTWRAMTMLDGGNIRTA